MPELFRRLGIQGAFFFLMSESGKHRGEMCIGMSHKLPYYPNMFRRGNILFHLYGEQTMRLKLFCVYVIIFAALCAGGVVMAQAKDTNETLSPAQQAIIPIAAFTANGDTKKLAEALNAGLDNGLSVNAIKEILVQMYAYTGFPRSLTALNTFMDVLKERKDRGITDPEGQTPEKFPLNADRRTIGAKNQTELVGRPVAGPVYEFCPAIDAFLKEHLFCDIFSRGVLTTQERELATVAALAALPAEAQLASHLRVCLHNGLTPAQLRNYVDVLSEKVGKSQAELASGLLEKILKNTNPQK